VMSPPGWARLATIPLRTGSPTKAMTIGTVVVACVAASAAHLRRGGQAAGLTAAATGAAAWFGLHLSSDLAPL
jgi:hypothetical protein